MYYLLHLRAFSGRLDRPAAVRPDRRTAIHSVSLLALAALLLAGARVAAAAQAGQLSSLHVAGAGPMTPAFDPEVFHYAVRCDEQQDLSVSAAAARPGARLRLNGKPVSGPLTDAGLRLAGDESLVVEVAAPARNGAADERAAYAVHCVPHDFPDVKVVRKEPGRAPGLLLVTPYYNVAGADEPLSYLAILDDNGVPRFTRRSSPPAHNFRWHEGAGVYSYNEAQPNAAGDVVLLDERLEEVGRVNTVGGLAPAMMHEFLITDEGNYLFIANTPAVRDLSRYPAPDGKPAPTDAQATHDSVIQEVAPDGREVFRWNAWDHLKLSDCAGWQFFPDKYAHLNSLDLDEAGNVLAGFRGCSLVLKIERPSGHVLWQLGGSDPGAPDAYDERRPAFDRPWYRPTGDPHGGFCTQHSVLEPAPGRILMFDNGRCGGGEDRDSRVVEYRLDRGGEAVFARHYEPGWPTFYGGAVTPLANGNWLIAWGGGPGNATLSEVDAAGRELFALRLSREPQTAMTYRAYRRRAPQPTTGTGTR